MVPDYLIIEEEKRREREELLRDVPLHAPSPLPVAPLWPDDEPRLEESSSSERGAWIINLDDFSVVRL